MLLLSPFIPAPLKESLALRPAQMWEEGAREWGGRCAASGEGERCRDSSWAGQPCFGSGVGNGPHRPLLFWPYWSAAVSLAS